MILAILQARTSSTRLPGNPQVPDIAPAPAARLRSPALRATAPEDREQHTPTQHRRSDAYRQACLSHGPDEGDVRWTVDFPHDYAFVAAVYDALYPTNRAFT